MGSELTVGDVMTKHVITVEPDEKISTAAKVMEKHKIGSVIVAQGKKAIGIITERDIVIKLVAKEKNPNDYVVKDIMSKPLRVILPDNTIEEAARAMKENRIKRLPVVDKNMHLIGILSETDILRVFPAVIDLIEERAQLG